jgi:hypothetical protein
MFVKVIVSALPASCLRKEDINHAPVAFLGEITDLARRFPKNKYPNLIRGQVVESPSGEKSHYLSLVQKDEDGIWRPPPHV